LSADVVHLYYYTAVGVRPKATPEGPKEELFLLTLLTAVVVTDGKKRCALPDSYLGMPARNQGDLFAS
jgi:hypothetical protein